jgi:hypothetical protein
MQEQKYSFDIIVIAEIFVGRTNPFRTKDIEMCVTEQWYYNFRTRAVFKRLEHIRNALLFVFHMTE